MTDQTPPSETPEPTPRPSKRRWVWPTIIGIVALVAGIGIGSAMDTTTEPTTAATTSPEPAAHPTPADKPSEPEPEPEPEDVPVEDGEPAALSVGDTITFTDGGTDAGEITISDLKLTTQSYDSYGEGPKNDHFAIFTVTVKADATTSVYEDDFYIKMKDGTRIDHGDGNSYDAVDYDDMLGYADLNAGEKKTAVLVFDIEGKHGELAWAPNYDGGPIGTWTF